MARSTELAFDLRHRGAWAEGLASSGPLAVEAPGDVRVLVLHHSASSNAYAPADVPDILRGFHRYHTGPEKGWPDIAYNFLVDRFGVVWEGREGSIAGPVRGDATGGSQGFSQLVCLIGDHTTDPPTIEAKAAAVAVLAWLAERYGVPTDATARAQFVSRGSNLLPAGLAVDLPTIAGHREVSQTSCPGDAAFAWVRDELMHAVETARPSGGVPAPTSTEEGPRASEAETTSTSVSSSAPPSATTPSTVRDGGRSATEEGARGGGWGGWLHPGTGLAAGAVAAVAAAVGIRRRRL